MSEVALSQIRQAVHLLSCARVEIERTQADNAKKVTLQCWKCSSILAIPLCRECATKEVQGVR